ncbi:ABC transporter ATP-binding protein, partial [Bifidobacterium sp. 82T10]|nr:ABC transporter ATP-binding protein [Bifidobacterium miconis]
MYVDPTKNQDKGNLRWILPYCKPDLPRVAGALVLFCANNTMALTIPLLSGMLVDQVITQGHTERLAHLCMLM